ncbi:MAG: amidohydrolase family protein [Pseudomonadota bacterium]
MDPAQPLLEDAALAIDAGRIIAIGPLEEIAATYEAREQVSESNRVLMPGLVNTHSHAAMTILRGIADDQDLITWLNDYIFPAEVRFVDDALVSLGTELACAEMIRGGTTTFVDMYYHPDAIAEAVARCGLRAFVSATVIDQHSPDAADAAEGLANAHAFIRRWKGKHPRITPILGPHSVYTLAPSHLKAVSEAARSLDVPISIHLSESRFEIDTIQSKHDTTPVGLLDSMDFFNNRVIAAHVVYPTEEDVEILASRRVGVAHCPTSNMKISSGIAPISALLAAGVEVGIGTDGAASNNDLDMFEELRLSALLQKVATMEPTVLPASAVLEMATAGGARAIGLGDEIGSLRVGMRADLIQIDLSNLHFAPLYDVISHLAYVADEQDVVTVIVDGRVVMRERALLTIDIQRVRAQAQTLAERIAKDLRRNHTPVDEIE